MKEYQKLASQVNELVGRINGTFGTLDYSPIHYIQRPVSTEELCALYNVANACIITSVRDGMNLVSHEYVAMQEAPCPGSRDGPGMLVLSNSQGRPSPVWCYSHQPMEHSGVCFGHAPGTNF